MNFIKKLFIILSAPLLVCSCSDDDDVTDVAVNATISLSTEVIQADKQGGSFNVTVTSSADWRLAGVCDWAHPSVTSGKSGDVVSFTIDANTEDVSREATFKFFTGSAVAPLQVESQPAYVMNLLSDTEMEVSKEAGTVNIQLNTNVLEPEITLSDGAGEWLSFDRSVEFGDKVIMSFVVLENEGYKNRSTVISLSSPLVDAPVEVALTQKQTDAIFLEENSLMYDLEGRTISFDLKYNVDYDLDLNKGEDWIHAVSVSDPVMGSDGLSTVTYTYTLDESTTTRAGVLYFIGDDVSAELVLVQKDPNVELVTIPDDALRKYAENKGWILALGGSQCVVLEEGLNATSFSTGWNDRITDLTGIEYFPNLTSINLGYAGYLSKVDISKLHNVSSLSVSSTYYITEYNLGDNPITSFYPGGTYTYSYVENLKFISTQLETLQLNIYAYYGNWDTVTSLDVSECPALTTLNASNRNQLKTVYLKEGQEIPNLTLPSGAEIVYK